MPPEMFRLSLGETERAPPRSQMEALEKTLDNLQQRRAIERYPWPAGKRRRPVFHLLRVIRPFRYGSRRTWR